MAKIKIDISCYKDVGENSTGSG